MKEFSSACPRNCYSTCSIKVRVENDKVIGIDPHPENLAIPEGPCIKGLAYVERANSKDRILYPQKRIADGKYERISWDEALNTISEKLQYCKDSFGPHSVLYFANGWSLSSTISKYIHLQNHQNTVLALFLVVAGWIVSVCCHHSSDSVCALWKKQSRRQHGLEATYTYTGVTLTLS